MGIKIYPLSDSKVQATIFDPNFSSQFSTWRSGSVVSSLDLHAGTHFGYVHDGKATLEWKHGSFDLKPGMYFSVPGEAVVHSQHGQGFVATRVGFLGLFQIGGPVEERGRLRYIDGCSDSLLLSPIVQGDPCLNLLYLPPRTAQTEHTHPSCRVGVIASGRGVCRTPGEDFPLQPGDVFEIPPHALHSFHTQQESLRVIAWHPDSDHGPTNHDHPMINRTIINGRSAAEESSAERSGGELEGVVENEMS